MPFAAHVAVKSALTTRAIVTLGSHLRFPMWIKARGTSHPGHEPSPAPVAKVRDRSATTSGELVIESVVVGPEGASSQSEQPASPKRGWWQRTLGG